MHALAAGQGSPPALGRHAAAAGARRDLLHASRAIWVLYCANAAPPWHQRCTPGAGLLERCCGHGKVFGPGAPQQARPGRDRRRLAAAGLCRHACGSCALALSASCAVLRASHSPPPTPHPNFLRCHLQDGWMRTGDLAMMDGLGYCQIVGRIKDMVIRGGEVRLGVGSSVCGGEHSGPQVWCKCGFWGEHCTHRLEAGEASSHSTAQHSATPMHPPLSNALAYMPYLPPGTAMMCARTNTCAPHLPAEHLPS